MPAGTTAPSTGGRENTDHGGRTGPRRRDRSLPRQPPRPLGLPTPSLSDLHLTTASASSTEGPRAAARAGPLGAAGTRAAQAPRTAVPGTAATPGAADPPGPLGWHGASFPRSPAAAAAGEVQPRPAPALRRLRGRPGGARPRAGGGGRGEARRRPGRKPQDGPLGRGWSPTRDSGAEAGAARGPAVSEGEAGRRRLPGEPPQTKARRLRSARGGGGGCPAQAQTVAAPASGRPAASPHSRPNPSPVRPLRLTVPGRAHELVQQGPHLRLGGHGGRRGRQGRRLRLLSERWGQQQRRQQRRNLVASASSLLSSFPPRGTPGGSASAGALSLLGNVVSGWAEQELKLRPGGDQPRGSNQP